MDINELVKIGSAGAVAILGFICNESGKEIIKKFFSGMSRKQVSLLFYSVLGLAVFGTYYAINITSDQKATKPQEAIAEEKPVQVAKSNAELILEAAPELIEESKELVNAVKENKQRKDSIREANREKLWVYQVGLPVSREDDLWDVFRSIKSKTNVYAFKESRRRYILVKDGGFRTETEASEALEAFQAETGLQDVRVKVIDLLSLCPRKGKLVQSDKITARKEKTSIPCFTCD